MHKLINDILRPQMNKRQKNKMLANKITVEKLLTEIWSVHAHGHCSCFLMLTKNECSNIKKSTTQSYG